jgi:hypothetical protein
MTPRPIRCVLLLAALGAIEISGVRLASAQTTSGQQNNAASANARNSAQPGAQSSGMTEIESQWNPGAKSFGSTGEAGWERKNGSATGGLMWNAGTGSFGASAQQGGVWRAPAGMETGAAEVKSKSAAGNAGLGGASTSIPATSSLFGAKSTTARYAMNGAPAVGQPVTGMLSSSTGGLRSSASGMHSPAHAFPTHSSMHGATHASMHRPMRSPMHRAMHATRRTSMNASMHASSNRQGSRTSSEATGRGTTDQSDQFGLGRQDQKSNRDGTSHGLDSSGWPRGSQQKKDGSNSSDELDNGLGTDLPH